MDLHSIEIFVKVMARKTIYFWRRTPLESFTSNGDGNGEWDQIPIYYSYLMKEYKIQYLALV